MLKPGYPANEVERQREVDKYQILDTLPTQSYDSITALMAYIYNAPISLVSILDKGRNFLKSHHGVPFSEDPRDRSFCGHTILFDEEIMIVPDASKDERFADNPLVTEMGVKFYAGVPLINDKGFKIGALCVFDVKPKEVDEHQVQALINMAKQVMVNMESHYQNLVLQKTQDQLEERNENLKKFAALVSHDLKSPISNITGVANILEELLMGKVDKETQNWVQLIQKSCFSLAKYIDGILAFYKSDELLNGNVSLVKVSDIAEEIESVFNIEKDVQLHFNSELQRININKGAVMQILLNLITNGIKYNCKDTRVIDINIFDGSFAYQFEVHDNGNGIHPEEREIVFELFETSKNLDRYGSRGTGIGLCTVKKIIENLEGEISFESTVGKGTHFYFSIPKV